MKRLLITGAGGLLGINLALVARARYEVYGALRKERVAPGIRAPFRPLVVDLAQPGSIAQMLDEAAPDVIVHAAAMTDMDACEARPEEAGVINACVPELLAQETARRGVKLVHISTDAVFDGAQGGYTEADIPYPLNTYARTKLEGERRVAQCNPEAIIARVNFYGWSWTGARSLAEFFFYHLASGQPVRGFANVIFCPLLVTDLVEILLQMIELRLAGLYHAVSSEYLSKCEFGRLLACQFGFDEKLVSQAAYHTGDLKAPRARNLSLSAQKLAEALGAPLPAQADPMRRFHQQYLDGYPDLIRSLLVSVS